MTNPEQTVEKIHEIVGRDRRYRPEAYVFVLEALSYTLDQQRRLGREGHIDGRQLSLGIRDYASKQFGYLARAVFAEWGVRRTLDFGEIVFNLVEVQLLSKQETDLKHDFADVYDFCQAFEEQFIHP